MRKVVRLRRPASTFNRPGWASCVFAIVVLFGPFTLSAETEFGFFESKVQPLLDSKCVSCHSHGARAIEGGLTLDSRSGWQTGGDRGPAIFPGQPKQSLLIEAVRYDNPDLQMPPDEKLSDSEISVLERWISEGANDPRESKTPLQLDANWWSLKPLSRSAFSDQNSATTTAAAEPHHPIDAFIAPTAKADRVTLARRLYVDLHGMQPSPAEVNAFVQDQSPDAYSHMVDRLLESPRYGERWARHWLDVIHFADSHGCEHDVKRDNAWRYRDYVIQRLNDDVAWDQFIREQLAPDVFYPEQPQLMAGLGFIAAGPLELSRAGTAPVAFDYLDRDDMVTQTMAAFVSTTANCARCHTHKFDPITQEDYYALQAVFAGIGKGDIEFDSSPNVMKRRRELESLLAATISSDKELLLSPLYSEAIEQWVARKELESVNWVPLDPDVFLSSGGATLTKQDDGTIFASGTVPDQEHYTITSQVTLKHVHAIRLDVFKDKRLPKNGPGRAANGNLHLSEIDIQWFPEGGDAPKRLTVARASADFDQDGWTSAQAIDGDDKTGWAIFPRVDESHYIVFELAEPIESGDQGKLAVTLKQLYPPKHLIGRFRLLVTDAEEGAATVISADARQGLKKPRAERSEKESLAIAAAALNAYARKELAALPPKQVVYGVSNSWSHAKKLSAPQSPKPVHLLRRGSFDKPLHEVGPGALSALDFSPARFELANASDESQRRAALADWLAHPDNPLTWRSIVNRVWHYHFGRGLVDTPNDFGRMGSRPAHPELLDWLAVWFRDEAKGSLKELHRLILTSGAWQSSSAVSANSSAEQHLTRQASVRRRRLDADVFRDSVLRISGKLDLTMGGPGIEQFAKTKGPQATSSLDYSAYDWNSPGSTRRSIYRVVWRGIPDPFLETLDFPDLGLLAPQRGNSVSALQSLALLNNHFVLHFSDQMAQRIESRHDVVADQVAMAVQATWLRLPTDNETNAFTAYVKQYGLAAFCRLLFNSNEFLYVD